MNIGSTTKLVSHLFKSLRYNRESEGSLVGFAGTIYSFPDKFRLYLQSYFSTFICKVTFPDKAVFM